MSVGPVGPRVGAFLLALDLMGVHHGIQRQRWSRAMDQGQDRRPEAPFKVQGIWALRVRLQMEDRVRELALFNLGIDSKLRGCDLISLKVRDICHGDQVASRAVVMQDFLFSTRRSAGARGLPKELRCNGRDRSWQWQYRSVTALWPWVRPA
jgi:hypothetical protein